MKISFLHMTMGLATRGSEVVTDLVATKLALSHDVQVLGSGKLENKKYQYSQVSPLSIAPPPAPRNLLEKIIFRLGVNLASREVIHFTKESITALIKFSPDIIIVVNGTSQLKIIKRAFPGVKTVVFGHAGIGHDDLRTLRAIPNLFITLSNQAEKWANKYKSDDTKVVHIPNPINTKKFSLAKPLELNMPRPIVITVGALTSYKNIPNVIKAIKYLKASLLLIGDGEDSKTVTSTLSDLDNEFSWIKTLDPSQMPAYYASSHIFCFVPDQQEAFGRVYLEAMAAGLPIVASDDPIRRSIIGDSGYYVDPHDPVSIAKGIEQAVKGKRKIDYSEQLKPYQLNTVIKNIQKEFHDLI